jgi:hypothetical protein
LLVLVFALLPFRISKRFFCARSVQIHFLEILVTTLITSTIIDADTLAQKVAAATLTLVTAT